MLVPVTSVKPHVPYDQTCLLYPGDHPFVRHDSFVLYQKSRVEDVNKILRGVKIGQLIPKNPIDGSVFARICKGLEDSRFTPVKLLTLYLKATGR